MAGDRIPMGPGALHGNWLMAAMLTLWPQLVCAAETGKDNSMMPRLGVTNNFANHGWGKKFILCHLFKLNMRTHIYSNHFMSSNNSFQIGVFPH
jgi:hypothetical protein